MKESFKKLTDLIELQNEIKQLISKEDDLEKKLRYLEQQGRVLSEADDLVRSMLK